MKPGVVSLYSPLAFFIFLKKLILKYRLPSLYKLFLFFKKTTLTLLKRKIPTNRR